MNAKTRRRLEKMFRMKHDGASEWDWLEQFQLQMHIYTSKFTNYWTYKINSCGSDFKTLVTCTFRNSQTRWNE